MTWRDPRDVACPDLTCEAPVGQACKQPPGIDAAGMVHASRIELTKRFAQ